jgi:hypothetical protein
MGSALQAYFAWHPSRNSGSSHRQRLSPRERSGNEKVDPHCFQQVHAGGQRGRGVRTQSGPDNRSGEDDVREGRLVSQRHVEVLRRNLTGAPSDPNSMNSARRGTPARSPYPMGPHR